LDAIFDIAPDPEIEPMVPPPLDWPPAHAVFEEGQAARIIEAYRKQHFDEKMLTYYREQLPKNEAMSGSTLFATAPVEEVKQLLMTRPLETWIFIDEAEVGFLLALLGDEIIPRLFEFQAAEKLEPLGLLWIRAPQIVTLAAARAVGSYFLESRLAYFSYLAREKERALPVLLRAVLTTDGQEQVVARKALRWLCKRDGDGALREIAKSWNVKRVDAILAPVARKLHDKAGIPKSWGKIEPPTLSDGTALSKDQFAKLLGFLGSEPDPAHPATNRILGALDSDSLRAWMTAVEAIWTAKGSALTHLWIIHATCLVHGDAGIRKMGSWARNKSTSSNRNERTRSGKTVDALVEFDSVAATAQLADIAALAKAELARQRADAGFRIKLLQTNEPVEAMLDRAVPDLGMQEGVVFDYGPRRFAAMIDNKLEIVLLDENGERLSDLPAARKTDDKKKAKAAVLEWRAFKKDAATLIDVQRKRLEHRMTSGRRMAVSAFLEHFLANPILAPLARGVVWGAWSGAKPHAFRVAEDLSFADANDRAIEVVTGEVSVLHPLEIEDARAWHERFQDYEIIQPIEQLARQTFTVKPKREISECKGWIVSPGAIVGLMREGWKSSYRLVDAITKSFGENREVQVVVSPGFELSEAASGDDQSFGSLRVSAELLEDRRIAIMLSEMLRELSRARRKVGP
jgi:hypothetical protein